MGNRCKRRWTKKRPKISLFIWADSHGLHHFPREFAQEMSNPRNAKFDPPQIRAQGGRVINPTFVNEVNNAISQHQGPQCHVLIIG